jgi:hypothetical protein
MIAIGNAAAMASNKLMNYLIKDLVALTSFLRERFVFVALAPLCLSGLTATLSAQETPRESIAGMKSAQAQRNTLQAETYNLRYGPFQFQTETSLGLGLTDNVLRSEQNRSEDLLINPELTLRVRWPVTQLNTFNTSLTVAYEKYINNSSLSSEKPLLRPNSELVFNIYSGDFRIQLHEKPSYEETLFFNSIGAANSRFYNFVNTGEFARFDNFLGFKADWDLHDLILSVGYDFEAFLVSTTEFRYMDRYSHFLSPSVTFLVGEKAKVGLEAEGSIHDFRQETILDDHWRARVGPFAEFQLLPKISLRVGGGYETAQYDDLTDNSDFQSYYAYGRITQILKTFTHSLSAGHENLLGDNANNMENTFVRYNVSIPIIHNLEVKLRASANFAREFGGSYEEEFDFYRGGVQLGWQFHKYARATLGYDYTKKASDLPLRGFYQNFLTMAVACKF